MNFDSLFFERFIRGECSETEQIAFEDALTQSESLRQEFVQAKAYFSAIQTVHDVPVSEDFTDRVVEQIRLRAEKRSFAFPLFRGIFSREVIGVVSTVIVLAVVFRSHFSGVIQDFKPVPSAMDQLSSSPMQKSVPVTDQQSTNSEQVVNPQPAVSQKEQAVSFTEISSEKPVPNETVQDNEVISIAESAPSVALDQKDSKELRSEESAGQIYAQATAPIVEESKSKRAASPKAMREESLADMSNEPIAERTTPSVKSEKGAAKKARDSFPFGDFNAVVTYGDTLVIAVPNSQVKRFTKAWSEFGGSVVRSVAGDSITMIFGFDNK